MRRLARLLMMFAALALPLQAVAGLTMKVCGHAAATQVVAPAAEAEPHCPYHDAGLAAAEPQQSQQDCNDCGICQLACSGYMPASTPQTAATSAGHPFHARPAAAQPSHIPEPPQYPPKRSA